MKIPGSFSLFFAFLFSASAAGALSVAKTERRSPKSADFFFSGCLSLKKVRFRRGIPLMPFDKRGRRKYRNIRILSRSFRRRLVFSYKGIKYSAAGPDSVSFRVERIRKLASPFRIANAEVSFDGELLVVFGVLRYASGKLALSLPSGFAVSDASLKKNLEKEIFGRLEGL